MTSLTDPGLTDGATAARDRARAWGRDLLAAKPWALLEDRVTLVVTTPPTGVELVPAIAGLWLALDARTARDLPSEYRALAADEVMVQRHRATATAGAVTLTITTDTAVDRLLQSLTPRALEARWQWRHVEVVVDRLRRTEQFAARASLLPDDGPERILRPLWVSAHAAARGLDGLTGDRGIDALPAAGEVAGALARIACVMDDGAYPPSDVLLPVARETRIGKRISGWFDGIVPAFGGDEAAARRVVSSADQVLVEVQDILAERYRSRPWLGEPEAFTLRAPR